LFLGQGVVLLEKFSQIDLAKITKKWIFSPSSKNANVAPGNITREILNWKLGRERKTPSRIFHFLNIFTILINIRFSYRGLRTSKHQQLLNYYQKNDFKVIVEVQ